MNTHFETIYTLVRAELKTEANTSLLGWLWWILDPALSLGIYYIAFGLILNRNTPGFVPFLCVGIVFWRWFQSSVMRGSGSIMQAAPLFAKVPIQKFTFPLVAGLADVFRFSLSLVLLLVFLWLFKIPPSLNWFWMLLLLGTQFSFILLVSCAASMMVPFFPDLRNMIGHAMHLLFFMSGIFFDPDSLQGLLKTLVYLNPIAGILASARAVLLHNHPPAFLYIFTVLSLSLLGLVLIWFLMKKFDKAYAKLS
jgi:lipopolysaccharide transport system permease protein